MVSFDASLEWVILLSPDAIRVKKAAEDLSVHIGLLAGLDKDCGKESPSKKPPVLTDVGSPAPSAALIVLNNEGGGGEQNGFSWKAGSGRVEICGESGRGLCNGIYSFLAALGLSWPAPGQEKLNIRTAHDGSAVFPLTSAGVNEPSRYKGNEPAAAPWRRLVIDENDAIKAILKKSEAFAAWAARQRYDAIIFPLAAFASAGLRQKLRQLKQFAGEYGITLEAGGRDLSSLVPRRYFFLHRDFFRMEGGRRKKIHHFCPTNPGIIKLIGKEGKKMFLAAGDTKVFHLWPDKGAADMAPWCLCPSCRAFSFPEQNRIAVNTAADVLFPLNPGASITYLESAGEGGDIRMRKNTFRMESELCSLK